MGNCCGCKVRQEQHALIESHTITYQSIGTSNNPKLLVDTQNKQYDKYGNEILSENKEELCDELELNLSLRNIPKRKMISCPCDPFVIVSIKDDVKNVYNVVGQTEIVDDNPNPDFSKDIRINYLFEQVQKLRLDIYDANDDDDDSDDDDQEIKTEELSKHDFVGAVEFIVGDLVVANGQKLVMAIEDKNGNKLSKNNGLQPLVIIRSHEVTNNYDEIQLILSANSLPKMKCFAGINPFFQIYRKTNDNQWASVYKSEYIKSSYSPNWKQFTIQTRRLCDGDVEKPILIKIYDWNKDALPVFTCELLTTLAQLLEAKSIQFDCKDCGQLLIRHAKILKKYPFVNYLKGGLEMHFMTAIDFTGSNGDPNDSKSLHYMGPPQFESEYMKVIKSVGSVLAPYDAEGHIHAYGFGANLNPQGSRKYVSHCFNLKYPSKEEKVDGIEGLIEAYKNCLDRVQLYGPTYLSEVIRTVAVKSMDICTQKSQSYNILLIITDGVINDMRATMDAIVDASGLPLSIVIVGVGDADFKNMESLDADDDPLKHSQTGQIMHRCIVKFVDFNEFKNQHISAIARETLEEIPEQVSGFMSMNNIAPNTQRIDQDDGKTDEYYVPSAPMVENT